MAVPKRKTSKMKSRQRKATHHKPMASPTVCAECGSPTLSHRVCPSCGYYRGKQVVTISSAE